MSTKEGKLNKIAKEQIPGGLAEGLTLEDIARKWADKLNISYDDALENLNKQLAKGIEIEYEHSPKTEVAAEISMDHLNEDYLYYNHLSDAENIAKEQGTFDSSVEKLIKKNESTNIPTINIEAEGDIKVNDEVFVHVGEFRKLTRAIVRDIDEKGDLLVELWNGNSKLVSRDDVIKHETVDINDNTGKSEIAPWFQKELGMSAVLDIGIDKSAKGSTVNIDSVVVDNGSSLKLKIKDKGEIAVEKGEDKEKTVLDELEEQEEKDINKDTSKNVNESSINKALHKVAMSVKVYNQAYDVLPMYGNNMRFTGYEVRNEYGVPVFILPAKEELNANVLEYEIAKRLYASKVSDSTINIESERVDDLWRDPKTQHETVEEVEERPKLKLDKIKKFKSFAPGDFYNYPYDNPDSGQGFVPAFGSDTSPFVMNSGWIECELEIGIDKE